MDKTLLSDRARALIRTQAQHDVDGASVYQGAPMLDRLMTAAAKEAEAYYQSMLERHSRLKAMVG